MFRERTRCFFWRDPGGAGGGVRSTGGLFTRPFQKVLCPADQLRLAGIAHGHEEQQEAHGDAEREARKVEGRDEDQAEGGNSADEVEEEVPTAPGFELRIGPVSPG